MNPVKNIIRRINKMKGNAFYNIAIIDKFTYQTGIAKLVLSIISLSMIKMGFEKSAIYLIAQIEILYQSTEIANLVRIIR